MAQWFVNGLYVNGATMTTTPAPYVGRVTQDANPKQSSVVVDAGLALNELKPTPDAPDSEEFVMAFPSASKGEARTLTFRRDLRDPNGVSDAHAPRISGLRKATPALFWLSRCRISKRTATRWPSMAGQSAMA